MRFTETTIEQPCENLATLFHSTCSRLIHSHLYLYGYLVCTDYMQCCLSAGMSLGESERLLLYLLPGGNHTNHTLCTSSPTCCGQDPFHTGRIGSWSYCFVQL